MSDSLDLNKFEIDMENFYLSNAPVEQQEAFRRGYQKCWSYMIENLEEIKNSVREGLSRPIIIKVEDNAVQPVLDIAYKTGLRDAIKLKPIADAPKDGRWILGYWEEGDESRAPDIIKYSNVLGKFICNGYAFIRQPTHFIEIPQSMGASND